MRILVHDYAGHPFQIELSRALAERGAVVRHAYSVSTATPQGVNRRRPDDPKCLEFVPLCLGKMIVKTSLWTRRRDERRYGGLLSELIERERPDVVLSGNTPTEAQFRAYRTCKALGIGFIPWLQDIYGLAAKKILAKKLGPVGLMAGSYMLHLDKRIVRGSDGVVLITEDFLPLMHEWGVRRDRCHVIHNWAPLDELPVRPKDNPWSREHGLHNRPCLLYSGTLAMKHNPALLLVAAERVAARGAEVVVVSEGSGAQWVKLEAAARGLKNLRVLPFQPFELMPDVVASGDVLLALLEHEAGIFSVPSKVLTYLCACRPLLLAVPSSNLAARIVWQQGAGQVVEPSDLAGFASAAIAMLDDIEARNQMAANARAYAEEHFRIDRIADRFLSVIAEAKKNRSAISAI